jgi:hypothetical protein
MSLAKRNQDALCNVPHKHTRPKAMAAPEGKNALVVQALPYLGQDNIGPREIEMLRSTLSPAEKRKLTKDVRSGADWIYETAKKGWRSVGLNKIAQMAAGQRADVFSETADRKGFPTPSLKRSSGSSNESILNKHGIFQHLHGEFNEIQ